MMRSRLWTLISLLALTVLACGTATGTATIMTATQLSTPGNANQANPAPTATVTLAPAASKLGDTVQQDGYSITVTAVDDPCKPSALYQVEAGKRIIGVEVVLANVSADKPLDVNPLYGTLVDTDGFTYNTEPFGCDGLINANSLAKGRKVRGIFGFRVPNASHPASIEIITDLAGGKKLQAGLAK